MRSGWEGVLYMVLLAIQFGFQPFFTVRFTRKEIPNITIVFVTELLKLLSCFAILVSSGSLSSSWKEWKWRESFVVAAIPSLLYALQNVVNQSAYRNLDPIVFNLINQTKLLWSALALYLLLNRGQSTKQIFALVLLFLASVLLTLPSGKEMRPVTTLPNNLISFLFTGVVPVFVGSVCSGIATALSQKALQNMNRNSYLYSMELAFGSILCLPFLAMVTGEYNVIQERGMWNDLTWRTMVPVVSNAAGGIIVGLVTKYAGGIRKGFSLIGGVLFTCFLQYFLEDSALKWNVWLSIPLVIMGIYIHTKNPLPQKPTKEKKN